MLKLGVIGGLGPMATALFMQMVIEMTDAETDQEHIEMLIHNCPSVPDRTRYILGKSDLNPEPYMAEIGCSLAKAGADLIAIPCITANYFYDSMSNEIPVPIINTIEETTNYLIHADIHTVGLMATDGTIQSGLFQKSLTDAGINVIIPSESKQKDVMHIIYDNVKANKSVSMEKFISVSEEMTDKGAETIILGCTELSVVRMNYPLGAGYLDAMQVMAKCAVEKCGRLRQEYNDLITKDGA